MSYFEMSGGVNFSETELQTTDCMKINISSLAWTGTTTTMWIVLQVSSSFTDKHSMTANLLHDSRLFSILMTGLFPICPMSAIQSSKMSKRELKKESFDKNFAAAAF